jgi:hypothetical protein
MGNGFIEEVTILTRRRQDKRKCEEIWLSTLHNFGSDLLIAFL